METIAALALVVGCLALSAFFSGSETALLRIQDEELEEEIEARRGPAALAIRDLLKSTSRLLVTILLGNNVTNILGASVASAVCVSWLGRDLGVATSAIGMTALVFLFCEVLPKAVAARHPMNAANAVAIPLYVIHQILRPMHVIFDKFVDPLVDRIVGKREGEEHTSAEEVLRISRKAEGGIRQSATPEAIIGATAGAAEMTVHDIMVPRTEIVAFPATTPPEELLKELMEERYTRVPIYDSSIDEVLGVIHFKDLVKLVQDGGTDIRPILKNVLRVPERKPILRLLGDMQRAFLQVAVVKDEFNVTQGLVTQEDILEELVGEIRDEFDREELHTIAKRHDGSYEALGRIKVLDFNRETGFHIPAERGDTLAGLVFNKLGRAPHRWETIEVPGYGIRVVDVSGTRITQVRVSVADEEPEESEAQATA